MKSLFELLFERYPAWRDLPLVERSGESWTGLAMEAPPPPEADVPFPLDIEAVNDEVTISFDYTHTHIRWPVQRADAVGDIFLDAFAMIEAILDERIVASSGWTDGELRVGSLHRSDEPARLLLSRLQRLRTRSWKGSYNRDEAL